jgi:predicted glycoside hydrolase/deacetylase ChbG (UPF0249 family)
MKYCIVNGDDFGASPGVNRGIIEAHRRGILTSTSLMVERPGSELAATLSRFLPKLDVGLHLTLDGYGDGGDGEDLDRCRAALERQLLRFRALMDTLPTHLDSHHNLHRRPALAPLFRELSKQYGLPLREHGPVRLFTKFYGQWGGETHPEQVSPESLMRMLETEIVEGITELSCHPGYADPELRSGYRSEREAELRTLCDPRVREKVRELGIRLVGFRDLEGILSSEAVHGG